MAGVKVTDLPSLAAADLADIFYVVDSSGNESKKVDLQTIANALSTALPFIHLQGTTIGGQGPVTGIIDCEAGGTKGARIIFTYPNGSTVSLGGEFNDGGGVDYPSISLYNASSGDFLELYLRGGDLILRNVTLGTGTSNIIQSFDTFNNQRVLYNIDTNATPAYPNSDAGRQIIKWNNLAFVSNGGSIAKSWTPLPTHYFNDSCKYSQTGTSAPTEDAVFETQAGLLISKTLTYQAIGHYLITYNVGVNTDLMPSSADRVKVMATGGSSASSVHISAKTSIISASEVQVDIFTRGNGGAANGLLQGAFIDVFWYK